MQENSSQTKSDNKTSQTSRALQLPQILHSLPRTSGHPCAYLPGQIASDRGFSATRLASDMWEALLASGWRRSGALIYEPDCPFCAKCVPFRIPVAQFKPNRTQKRTLKRNEDLTVANVPNQITDERATLYESYILSRHDGLMSGSRREFEQFLGISAVHSEELEIRDQNSTLIAVLVFDKTPNAWNAVYCYFDPNQPKRSLGTFAILKAISCCRSTCKVEDEAYLYMGYWVPESQTMDYKRMFRPHQLRKQDSHWYTVL